MEEHCSFLQRSTDPFYQRRLLSQEVDLALVKSDATELDALLLDACSSSQYVPALLFDFVFVLALQVQSSDSTGAVAEDLANLGVGNELRPLASAELDHIEDFGLRDLACLKKLLHVGGTHCWHDGGLCGAIAGWCGWCEGVVSEISACLRTDW